MDTSMLIGKPIRSLQIMLRFVAAGNDRVDTVVPDGIYGEDTRRAVISFQPGICLLRCMSGIEFSVEKQNLFVSICSRNRLSCPVRAMTTCTPSMVCCRRCPDNMPPCPWLTAAVS